MIATSNESVPRNVLLRREREANGLSRRDLAAKVDLHPSYIHHIENGTRNPPAATLQLIAKVLQISPEQFEAAGPPEHTRKRNRDKSSGPSTPGGMSGVAGRRPSVDGTSGAQPAAVPPNPVPDGSAERLDMVGGPNLESYDLAFRSLVRFSSLAQELGPDTHRQLLKIAETMVQDPS